MINLESISNVELPNYKTKSKIFLQNIKNLVLQYFSNKPMFNEKNLSLYYFDDSVLNSNVSKNSPLVIYVEIDQPNNFKPQGITKPKRKQDVKIKEAYLTLKEIKKDLYNLFIETLNESNSVGQDKYSVIIKNAEEEFNYYIKVIPCFTYTNESGVNGVIYYDDKLRDVEIEYPKLSIKNYTAKNKKTGGIFNLYVLAFKTLYQQQKKVFNITFEPFEIILYNAPNELFNDYSKFGAMQLINYLRNKNLRDFKTLDEQDYAFTSKYKSLSALYAINVIKQLSKLAPKQLL